MFWYLLALVGSGYVIWNWPDNLPVSSMWILVGILFLIAHVLRTRR
jgi:hypothetical protein